MKRLYKYKELLFIFGLIAIYLVWSFSSFMRPAGAGLDNSWCLGLNWGSNIGAKWGKDILFTYGPLYHFSGHIIPDFYSPKAYLLIQIGLNLFYSVIKAGVVLLFYRRANSSYKMYAAIFSLVVMLLCPVEYIEFIVFFAVLLLCDSFYELYENNLIINRRLVINNVLAPLLLVIAQYTKFSFFNIAIVLLVLFIILYLFRHKYKIITIFAGSYVFFSILLWIISGQNIKYLFKYIYTGLQFSSGYTPAMNIHFIDSNIFNIFVFAFIIIGSFLIMLLYFAKKKKYLYFIICFFISPQIFLLFKESFVRADGHAYVFMSNIPVIALYFLFVSVLFLSAPKSQSKFSYINPPHYVIIAAILVILTSINVANVKFLPKNDAYQILKFYQNYKERIKEQKNKIFKHYSNFNELIDYIDTNEKTDIFPYDISLLYAYDLNWQPRPVIQSYTNYTPALDKLTAGHFLTEKAPDKLIYTPMTIDGRYALFDEPETFRTVLLNYSSIANNNSYLILGKNKQVNTVKEEICTVTARKGEIIEVPYCEDAYVFMEIDWDFNFFGKLANFFFKTTYANIELQLADGTKPGYRFVHKNGRNGLFVSKYVSNTQELVRVFDKDFTPDITGVRILGKNLFYKKSLKIKFYKIKDNRLPFDMKPVITPITNIPLLQNNSNIWVNDISISKQDNNMILYCGTTDPCISFPLQETINKPSFPHIEIKYSNSKAGTIQFFYDYGNGYSENNSIRTKLEISSERTTLRVPIINWQKGTKLNSIRIDPPDGSKFELESIWLYGKNND